MHFDLRPLIPRLIVESQERPCLRLNDQSTCAGIVVHMSAGTSPADHGHRALAGHVCAGGYDELWTGAAPR